MLVLAENYLHEINDRIILKTQQARKGVSIMKIYVRIWFAILPAVEASIATVALTSAEDKVMESPRRSAILKVRLLDNQV